MDDKKIKQAFRVAYDFVDKHRDPKFSTDYFSGILAEFNELRAATGENMLLDCLLTGVYEYLAKVAKEGSEK